MNLKKLILVLLSLLLVCVVSVSVTVAFLKAEVDDPVKNTFAAIGLFTTNDNDNFLLLETAVKTDSAGNYVADNSKSPTDEGIRYQNLFPGMEVYKRPYIQIQNKSSVPSWLFIEIVEPKGSNIFEDDFEAHIDTSKWEKLERIHGPNDLVNGVVYCYKDIIDGSTPSLTVDIFNDFYFTVEDFDTPPEEYQLAFYAYMCQPEYEHYLDFVYYFDGVDERELGDIDDP